MKTKLSEYSKIIGLKQRQLIKLTGTPKSSLEAYWSGKLKTPDNVLNAVVAVWIKAGGTKKQLETAMEIRQNVERSQVNE